MFTVIILTLGMNRMIIDLTLSKMLLLLPMKTFLIGQPNFNDIILQPFTEDSGPSLHENFDASVATALDCFNLLFKPELFSDTRDHISSFAIFKEYEI